MVECLLFSLTVNHFGFHNLLFFQEAEIKKMAKLGNKQVCEILHTRELTWYKHT